MMDFGLVDPDRLHPALRAALLKRVAPLPDLWLVTFGWRSLEEQAALYQTYKAGGPLAAPPGLSAHNYGLAVDLVLDVDGKMGGAVSWDTRKYAKQWGRLWAAIDASPELHSGRFWHPPDGGHVEMCRWRQFLERKQP